MTVRMTSTQGEVLGDEELRRTAAIASLQESWREAEQRGLDQLSDDQIDEEIQRVRERKTNPKNEMMRVRCGSLALL